MDSVPSDDEFVAGAELSQARIDRFLSEFKSDRAKAATTETLFADAGAFRHFTGDKLDAVASGFDLRLLKGPFVDGANWLSYQTWEFAVAMERHLVLRLEEVLRHSASSRSTAIEVGWDSILAKVDEMIHELEHSGWSPAVIVVAGPLSTDLLAEFHKTQPLHSGPRPLWILGAHRGISILRVSAANDFGVYVADLGKFAELRHYGDKLDFSVQSLDEQDVERILAMNPHPVQIPPGRSETTQEKRRLLRLQAKLHLFECYDIVLKNGAAALGAPMSLPS